MVVERTFPFVIKTRAITITINLKNKISYTDGAMPMESQSILSSTLFIHNCENFCKHLSLARVYYLDFIEKGTSMLVCF